MNGSPSSPPGAHSSDFELSAFGLKLAGTKSAKRLLISAGPPAAKARLVPLVKTLREHNVEVYATDGTADFFAKEGIEVSRVYKITEAREPNIKTLFQKESLDCVINVLVGEPDYDAASDSKVIRSLAIRTEIPLITDPDLAVEQLSHLLERIRTQSTQGDAWDLRSHFEGLLRERGGWANHHAHFDKAFLISQENLTLSQADMQKKWYLYRYLKENYTWEDLYARISRCVERFIAQGCRYCRTMVDADSIVKTLPLDVALQVKQDFADRIHLDIGVQPLEGVIDPAARKFFEKACERADFVGGLPSRDRPQVEKHLDIIFGLAKSLGKQVDVHIDQENNPDESETELLALKTIEHGLEGRVFGVHAISLAAKPAHEQDRIIKLVVEAKMNIICCPSAALSMKALDRQAPLHNSIAPVPRLLEQGVPVFLGIDNIADLFMPLVDADLWFECRMLMEACRFYQLEAVADIASRRFVR